MICEIFNSPCYFQGRKTSVNSDVITGVRQAVRDFVAPGTQELRGKIKAPDARVAAPEKISEAPFSEKNIRLDARFSEIGNKLDTLLSLRDLFNPDSRHRDPMTARGEPPLPSCRKGLNNKWL
jgi:hypothetical protein